MSLVPKSMLLESARRVLEGPGDRLGDGEESGGPSGFISWEGPLFWRGRSRSRRPVSRFSQKSSWRGSQAPVRSTSDCEVRSGRVEVLSSWLSRATRRRARSFKINSCSFAKIRIGVCGRHEVAVALQQSRRNSTKYDVTIKARKNRLVSQVRVFDYLSVISCFLGNPAFEFDQQPGIPHEHRPDLNRRCGHPTVVVFG